MPKMKVNNESGDAVDPRSFEEHLQNAFEDEVGEENSEEADPSTEEDTAEIVIGDSTFTVPMAVAQALEDAERRSDDVSKELRAYVDSQLNKIQSASRQEVKPAEQPNFDMDKFLENPEAFLSKYAENIEQKVTQKLTQQYESTSGRDKFWQAYAKENKDLDNPDMDFLSKATFAQHYDELAPLSADKAIKRLAQLTRSNVVKFSKALKGLAPAERNPTTTLVKGSPTKISSKEEPKTDGIPKPDPKMANTLSEHIASIRRRKVYGKTA